VKGEDAFVTKTRAFAQTIMSVDVMTDERVQLFVKQKHGETALHDQDKDAQGQFSTAGSCAPQQKQL
jgi:hypothetical protein